MRIIADLHIHSHYSRATSKLMNLEELSKYARVKGVNLLGTGDFTHPRWFGELREKLSETVPGSGVYSYNNMNFMLTVEISLIYTQGGKGRRVHHVILAPSFEVAEQINEWLSSRGRLDYDGRPIFGFSSIEMAERLMGISRDIEIIPAHAWTPWFSIFGSKSGFDSVEECFGDQARHIHALETGLSSDPRMNWRVSSLDRYALVSFSDSHSPWPWRLGREATVFDLKGLDYNSVIRAIRTREGLTETMEFFPEEGKYHYDGHRACDVCMEPRESIRAGNICPVCRRPLTIGVLHRVEELADREDGFRPEGARPFRSLIPLSEIIASRMGAGLVSSKKVWSAYNRLLEAFGSEYSVLLEAGQEDMARIVDPRIAEAVVRVRDGRVSMQCGYDGEYGYPMFEGKPKKSGVAKADGKQRSIMDF
jgi:DNA helicase-2/ATP-dependent DNA helicase PcrA